MRLHCQTPTPSHHSIVNKSKHLNINIENTLNMTGVIKLARPATIYRVVSIEQSLIITTHHRIAN